MTLGRIPLLQVMSVTHEEYCGVLTQDGCCAKAVVCALGDGFEAWVRIGRVGSSGVTVAHVFAGTPDEACALAYSEFLAHVSALGLVLLPREEGR